MVKLMQLSHVSQAMFDPVEGRALDVWDAVWEWLLMRGSLSYDLPAHLERCAPPGERVQGNFRRLGRLNRDMKRHKDGCSLEVPIGGYFKSKRRAPVTFPGLHENPQT